MSYHFVLSPLSIVMLLLWLLPEQQLHAQIFSKEQKIGPYNQDAVLLKEKIQQIFLLQNSASDTEYSQDSIAPIYQELDHLVSKLLSSSDKEMIKIGEWGWCHQQYFRLYDELGTHSRPDPGFLIRADEVVHIAAANGLESLLGKIYLCIAVYHAKVDTDDKASIINYQHAIKYAATAKDSLTLANAYNGMGVSYSHLNFPDKAIEYYQASLTLTRSPTQLNSTFMNLSELYQQQKLFDQALAYLVKADSIQKSNNFPAAFRTSLYLAYAHFYNTTNDFDQAERYIQLARNLKQAMFTGRIWLTEGNIHFRRKNYETAILSYEKSLAFQQKNGYTNQVLRLLLAIGKSYLCLDTTSHGSHKEHLKKAKLYYQQSHALLATTQSLPLKKETYSGLKQIFLSEKNYKEALNMAELEKNVLDSINNEEQKAKFMRQEIAWTLERQKEADSLNQVQQQLNAAVLLNKKKGENILLYCSIAIIILAGALLFSRYKYRDKKRQAYISAQNELISNQKRELIETELDLLRLQINPHFLFNALNSIYFKINKEDKSARNALMGFSDILRYQLYEGRQPTVSIEKEIQCIHEYTKLQLMRTDGVTLNMKTDPNVSHFGIAPLILLPFIENAFKHLPENEELAKNIDIHLSKQNEIFIFTVRNSVDAKPVKPRKQMGIGMENVRRRLQLVYKDQFQLDINSTERAYIVQLKIQVE